MDREAQWATVSGVAKSQTQLRLTFYKAQQRTSILTAYKINKTTNK